MGSVEAFVVKFTALGKRYEAMRKKKKELRSDILAIAAAVTPFIARWSQGLGVVWESFTTISEQNPWEISFRGEGSFMEPVGPGMRQTIYYNWGGSHREGLDETLSYQTLSEIYQVFTIQLITRLTELVETETHREAEIDAAIAKIREQVCR